MSIPFFSVIIPVYNAERFLPTCLASLAAQTCPDFEIVLVDDGSTDGSGRICEEAAAHDSRIRFFSESNLGSCLSRNRGLQEARGSFVWFVDNDDAVHPQALEQFKQCLLAHPQLSGLALYHDHLEENAAITWKPCEGPLAITIQDLYSPSDFPSFYRRRFPLSVYDYVLRRQVVPLFINQRDVRCEGRIWQDSILLDQPIQFLGETNFIFYHYIQHPDSFIHKRGSLAVWSNTLAAFRQWMERPLNGRAALVREPRDQRLLSMINNDFLFTLLTLEPENWDQHFQEWIETNRQFFASHVGTFRKRIRFSLFNISPSRQALSFLYPKTVRKVNASFPKRGIS